MASRITCSLGGVVVVLALIMATQLPAQDAKEKGNVKTGAGTLGRLDDSSFGGSPDELGASDVGAGPARIDEGGAHGQKDSGSSSPGGSGGARLQQHGLGGLGAAGGGLGLGGTAYGGSGGDDATSPKNRRAQTGLPAGMGPSGYAGSMMGMEAGDSASSLDQVRRTLEKLKEGYRKAKNSAQREAAEARIRVYLVQYFDRDMSTRQAELNTVKRRVADLEQLLQKRTAAKNTIINSQLDTTIREAQGLGFFRNQSPRGAFPGGSGGMSGN